LTGDLTQSEKDAVSAIIGEKLKDEMIKMMVDVKAEKERSIERLTRIETKLDVLLQSLKVTI